MALLNVFNHNAALSVWQCRWARMASDEGVLLIEDAVYALTAPDLHAEWTRLIEAGLSVYVLAPDATRRSVPLARWPSGVRAVDDAGFVELATQYAQVLSWS